MHHLWLVAILLTACAIDPVPPVSSDLVGTWRYMPADPSRVPVEQRQIVELGADGSYTIRETRNIETGTYEFDGRMITTSPDTGAGWITTGAAASGDRMIIDALFRSETRDGFVGTWTGAQISALAEELVTLDLRTDGSARYEQTGSFFEGLDATWIHDEPYVVVAFAGSSRTKPLPVLPGIAIGEWLYERVP